MTTLVRSVSPAPERIRFIPLNPETRKHIDREDTVCVHVPNALGHVVGAGRISANPTGSMPHSALGHDATALSPNDPVSVSR